MSRIQHRAIVSNTADRSAHERIAYFTSLSRLQSGDVLCGYFVGSGKHSPDGTLRLSRSTDEGRTWSDVKARFSSTVDATPGSLAGAEIVETEPRRLLLFTTWFDRSNPDRPLFNPETEGILRSKQLYAVSTDGGESWSDWSTVPTPGLSGCATTGPIVSWPDGPFAYAFESFKEYDDPAPPKHAAWIVTSVDGGRSFSAPLLIAQDPEHQIYYWDQRLCRTSDDGGFAAMFWTHDRAQQKDLRVHFATGRVRDAQIEMGPINETPIQGQIAAPCLLADGRLAAFVVDRNRPATMKLWVSADGGANWPEEDSMVIYEHEERGAVTQGTDDVDFAQYWEDMGKWTFGHPAVCRLGENRLLLAWYAGTPEGTSIHAAVVLAES